MYRDFALSVRGYSHVKEDLKCQDSACAMVEDTGAWALAVVADGHGGKDYFRSDVGSRLAVECAVQIVKQCLENMPKFVASLVENPEKALWGMEAGILSKWNSAVQEYDEQNRELTEWEQAWCAKKGVTIKEDRRERLYGTTLVLSILSPEFSIAIQNGDGACVAVYEDKTADFFIAQGDEDQAANTTYSLCNSEAMEHFTHRFERYAPSQEENAAIVETETAVKVEGETNAETELAPPEEAEVEIALMVDAEPEENAPVLPAKRRPVCFALSTDGLINSCMTPEDFLKFNRRVLSLMDDSNIRDSLERHFFDDRSTKGSQDDISIAMVYQPDLDLPSFRPS